MATILPMRAEQGEWLPEHSRKDLFMFFKTMNERSSSGARLLRNRGSDPPTCGPQGSSSCAGYFEDVTVSSGVFEVDQNGRGDVSWGCRVGWSGMGVGGGEREREREREREKERERGGKEEINSLPPSAHSLTLKSGDPYGPGVYDFSSIFFDLNSDGWTDLFIVGDFGTSRVYFNNGDGTFRKAPKLIKNKFRSYAPDAMGSALGDIDGDGRLDVFITGIDWAVPPPAVTGMLHGMQTGNVLYLNKETTSYDKKDVGDYPAYFQIQGPPVKTLGLEKSYWGWGASFLDIENDGDLDVASVNGFDSPGITEDDGFFIDRPPQLWINEGKPGEKMEDRWNAYGFDSRKEGRALLSWDYDSDGDLDMLIINNKDKAELFRNDGGNSQNFIRVEAVENGNEGGRRSSIGAKVYLKLDSDADKEIVGFIGTKEQYLSHGEVVAHFGLGPRTAPVHQIRIVWLPRKANVTSNTSTSWSLSSSKGNVSNTVIVRDVPVRSTLRVQRPLGSNVTEVYSASSLGQCGKLAISSVKQPVFGAVALQPGSRWLKYYPPRSFNGTITFEYTVSDGLGGESVAFVNIEVEGTKVLTAKDPKYRPFDGFSNNMDRPLMGCPFTPLRRKHAPAYDDGWESPSGESTRPSARLISNKLFKERSDSTSQRFSSQGLNELHVHFGQFLAHDSDFSTPFANAKTDSNFPISVPKGDLTFDKYDKGSRVIRFRRSGVVPGTGKAFGTPREHFNKISTFLDLSTVYGSDAGRAHVQRTHSRGMVGFGCLVLG